MRVLILVLALAMSALASCPNSCSGHGRCTRGDLCECFKHSDETTPAYVGADCSQRVCPYGRAFGAIADHSDDVSHIELHANSNFDGTPHAGASLAKLVVDTNSYKLQRSANIDVRVLSVSGTTVKIQWRLHEHGKYSQPHDATAGPTGFANQVELTDANMLLPDFGVASHETGIKVYFEDTTGVNENNVYSFFIDHQRGGAHKVGEPNTAHQFTECSGRGTCETSSGRCQCFPGFGGEACQRASCPGDCSGHGICQTLKRFVKDIGLSDFEYSLPWDAEKVMSCRCDVGYRGPDCSFIECPSGADPMGGADGLGLNDDDDMTDARDCSGRGTCDYSTGVCECYQGYHGERCESQTTFV